MYLSKNIAGIWIARFKGTTYYTGTRIIADAIAFALYADGAPQSFISTTFA